MASKRNKRSEHSSPGPRDDDAAASASSTAPGSQVDAGYVCKEGRRKRGAHRKKHRRHKVFAIATPSSAEETRQDHRQDQIQDQTQGQRQDRRQDKIAAAQAEQQQPASHDEPSGHETAATKDTIHKGTTGTVEAAPFAAITSVEAESAALGREHKRSLGSVSDEGAPQPASMPTTKSNSQSTTQAVIVCVALFFLFLVLTRNYLPLKALPRTIPLANYSVCRTSACLEYSKHLQRSLSTKANPCYNFYRFVCDSRSDLHPPEYDTLLTLTSERLKMHILRTWVEGSADAIIGDRVGETTLRAGSLLRSCVSGSRLSSYSSDRMSELRALMDERGLTWPHAPQSTPSAEDLLDVLVDWSLNWNVDVWFSLRVFLIDKVDRRVLFRISRSAILRRWPKERAVLDGAGEYIAFVNAHAREFGAKSSDEIDRAVHDVLEAEQEIESFFTDYETDSVLAMRDSKAKETEAEAERWRNAVRRSLGPSAYNATKQSIVFVSSQGLFAAVAILLSRGAKKEKYYSAIGWTVAREIGRLVSGSLRALHRMAGMELTLWCWNRMDKVTRSVLVEPFYESTLLRREMATVTQLFRSLRGTLSLAVTKNSWMDERTKEVTFSKIAAVSLGFGSSGSFAPHAPRSRQSRSDGNETLFAAWKRAFIVYQK
ncbi:hypothetical protein V5799_001174, partial [Amblyomma americanum]